MRQLLTLCLGIALFTTGLLKAAPDLVPMPKVYHGKGQMVPLNKLPIWIEANNRQCEIGSEELIKNAKRLGQKLGGAKTANGASKKGIYILTADSSLLAEFGKKLKLNVTATSPGAQGYEIKFSDNLIVIAGSDNVGALYGAITLCQMMKVVNNDLVAEKAEIRDWPDFKYRSTVSFFRGLEQFAYGEKGVEARLAAYKAGIDMMLRFKMNVVFDYDYSRVNIWDLPKSKLEFIKEINQYAVDRGVYTTDYDTTAIANYTKDKCPKVFQKWPCVQESRRGKFSYHCWSNDAMQREKIAKVADLYREYNYKMIFIHPVDGGSIVDPEQWSHRCAECKKRWKDDDRWKATAHQLNLWAEIFRERAPGITLGSPVYPYNAVYAFRSRFPEVTEAHWRQNSIDFWTKLNQVLDPSINVGSWLSVRSAMDQYRTCFKNRGVSIHANYPYDAGIFSTYFRFAITDYYGNPKDSLVARGTSVYAKWMTLINACEFGWTPLSPGNEEFQGLFYDPDKDHTKPEVIVDNWLPRACVKFYGKKVGEAITPMYQSGLQPNYIADPGTVLARANKPRLKPLAEMDQKNVAGDKGETPPAFPPLVENSERMAFQVKAAEKSREALQNAYKSYSTLDKYQKKEFMYYYKRMPLLLAFARAHYAVRIGAKLQVDGMFNTAASVLQKALDTFDKDIDSYKKNLASVKDQLDIKPINQLKFGMIPDPAAIRQRLVNRLADAKVILKPRRPGKKIRIALFNGSGAQGGKEFFDQFANVDAQIVDSLNLATLDKYDVVYICKSSKIGKTDFLENVRRYVVEGGGGVFIEHDLIGGERGYFGQTNPLPEICKRGQGRKDGREVVISTDHPAIDGAKRGDKMGLMYVDWVVPMPGDNGTVIVEDTAGEPVVVAGELGHGKAVFNGSISLSSIGGGYDCEEKKFYGLNAALAKGAVEWMTGVELERK